jgi:hypothetical protein
VAKGYRNGRNSLGKAALKGAIAGMVGGAVMKMVWEAEQKALLPKGESIGSPTQKAVETMAEEKGVELSEAQTTAAALTVYNGNMALWGAIYGAVQSRLHPPDALHGLLLGGLVYAANFPSFGVLPKLGVMPPPTMQSMEKAAIPVGAHIAFGLATAAAFDAMS